MIYLIPSSESYCFVDSPEDITEELKNLDQQNFHVGLENCTTQDIKVCFNDNSCDIGVEYNQNYLTKREEKFYFEGDSLMFAAIFSEKTIYDCQVKRLMQKTYLLTELYSEKNILTSRRGCQSNFQSELGAIKNFIGNFDSEEKIQNVGIILNNLEEKNKYSNCPLW